VDSAIHSWIARFADQRFSLTDAVTFELMRRERLQDAFAFDDDFRVAGYRLLG
jgi:predicted nucleic acid-binding protein